MQINSTWNSRDLALLAASVRQGERFLRLRKALEGNVIVDGQLVIRSRGACRRRLRGLWLLPSVVELAEGSISTHFGRQARKLVHGGGYHFALLNRV